MTNYDCCYKLVGAVIKSALSDYSVNIESIIERQKQLFYRKNGGPFLTKSQKQTIETKYNYLIKNKNDALFFFEKSPLFKYTGISFEYLKNHASEILSEDDEL